MTQLDLFQSPAPKPSSKVYGCVHNIPFLDDCPKCQQEVDEIIRLRGNKQSHEI